ncbi:collagen alpha-2(I) chain-like [Haliotis asinina]|uniref:collagen alpha-2(I) chain-like n=1 Tax=Haliotis asinina TaxID=109174 RepID=UPI003531D7D2
MVLFVSTLVLILSLVPEGRADDGTVIGSVISAGIPTGPQLPSSPFHPNEGYYKSGLHVFLGGVPETTFGKSHPSYFFNQHNTNNIIPYGQPGQGQFYSGHSSPIFPSQGGPIHPGQSGPIHPGQFGPIHPGQTGSIHPGQTGPIHPGQTGPIHPGQTGPIHPGQTGPIHPGQTGPIHPGQTGPIHPGPIHPGQTGPIHPGQTGPIHPGQTGPIHPGQTGPIHPGQTGPIHPGQTGPIHSGQTGPIHPGQTGTIHPSTGLRHNFNIGRTYGGSSFSVFNCPRQIDFSANLSLSDNPSGYPTNNITAELTARQDLATCFLMTTILPGAPEEPFDPVVAFSINTCPSFARRLWSFSRYGGRCWVIQNVQENVTFSQCLTEKCHNCEEEQYDGNRQNACIRNYNFISVWAFCENLPVQNQITRERIIVPTHCSCRNIPCYGYKK